MDMEIASEFIAMASHLMQIKTKMLLSVTEREEAMSEMEQLIRSLEERQRAGGLCADPNRGEVSWRSATRSGGASSPRSQEAYQADKTYRYKHEPGDLLRALATISERSAAAAAAAGGKLCRDRRRGAVPGDEKGRRSCSSGWSCVVWRGLRACSVATAAAARSSRRFWRSWSCAA